MTAPEIQTKTEDLTELGLSVPLSAIVAKRGRYSGAELRRRDPARFNAVIELLAQGWAKNEVAKELNMDWQTVDAISQDPTNTPAIREVSQRVRHLSGQIVEASLEHMLDKAVKGGLKAFDTKLVHDIHQVSSGLPTAIIEQRVTVSPEEWSGVLTRLQTGFEAGEKSAMAAAGQPGTPVIDVDVVVDHHQLQD